jgi:hypothetical protein
MVPAPVVTTTQGTVRGRYNAGNTNVRVVLLVTAILVGEMK